MTEHRGFLSRLLRDNAGNMMMIGAASIIPLVGVVGGGVDASRMYLAQTRLQQSCDAATLAARKELAGASVQNNAIPNSVKNKADNFFDANFPAGMYGTTNVNYTLTAGTATRMDGTATASVPTTLMKVFNVPQLDVSVSCSAELNLPNVDVVLVLDNSGSMRNSRIATLKTAVFSFYDELMAAKPAGTRVRIGLVPYSNTVNVGGIISTANVNWLKDSHEYESREALFRREYNDDGVEEGDVLSEETSTEILPRNSNKLGSSNSSHYHWNETNNKKKKECLAYSGTYTINGVVWEISDPEWKKDYFPKNAKKKKAACMADITKKTIAGPDDVVPPTYTEFFDKYVYREISFNTSQFKLGNSVSTPTGTEGASVSSTWGGCIEEAKTVATTDYTSKPAGAYDLDIDLVPDPTDPDTQWAPFWPEIVFDRAAPAEVETTDEYANNYHFDCPVSSFKLQEWPMNGAARNAAFETAVNSMVASGYTMHDIGMIWAGRLISPDGIFASDNAAAPNGEAISRHVIFMTDGLMEPGPSAYHAYGDYDMEGRVAGFASNGAWTTTDIGVHHSNRLELICNQIKNKNVTIWSVAFELAHTSYTEGCATGGSARAFTADNNAELIASFKQIATSIAELRLTQ